MHRGVDHLPLIDTVTPAQQADAAAAVRAAREAGHAVYPSGGGTRQDFGARPTRPGVGLSLCRLNRLIDYQPSDMTVTVEAGMTVASLGRLLAERRQRLPVDLARPDETTLGGAVAANLVGSRRFAHGTLRDYVLGLTAVDGRGEVFSGGGRVVKNAAGLNVHRLLIGSLGTLGVVTRLTLMVRPLPEATALLACTLPKLADAECLLDALTVSVAQPVSIDLLCGEAVAATTLCVGPGPVLLAGFEGTQAEVDGMTNCLANAWRKRGLATSAMTIVKRAETVWQAIADFPADVQVNVLPSRVVSIIELVRRLEPEDAVIAHAGNGVVLVRMGQRSPEERAKYIRVKLRPAIEQHDGRLTVLRRPAVEEFSAADVWGSAKGITSYSSIAPHSAALAQSLKQQFDPDDVLNPGRYSYSVLPTLACGRGAGSEGS